MIVLDANVLIAYLDDSDALHRQAVDALESVADEEWVAHPVTLAEVLVGPARRTAAHLQQAVDTLSAIGVDEAPWNGSDALTLAQLRAETHLKLPDCCVLLLTEREDSSLLSFDGALCRAAERRGITVVG
ncbi:type II toxin-antitoxin system VapC family toxin [Nostocoides veronense]|uniref:Ribonuclease VapC n=1 Tax=Nostocoides veronense TaxID=330836 RepID=A0ABN2M2K5_9MICO